MRGGVVSEPKLNQISSLRTPDKQVVDATRTRRFKWLHIPFVCIVAAIVGYGLLVVYAATLGNENYSFSRQLMGVAAGFVLMLLVWRFDYRKLEGYAPVLLVVTLALILSPHLPGIGVTNNGATSWINVGTQIQPGEFAKITVILLDAAVVSRYGGRIDDPREYLKVLAYILVPFLAIMTQPDLGTGLVYLVIGAFSLVMGGTKARYLLVTLGACALAVVAVFVVDGVYMSITHADDYLLLKQYQRNRLLVFMNQGDASAEGYNLQQAMIAIGSGGPFGKGFLNNPQSQLGYVPENATDFIFCVLAEQFGFAGSLLLLVLYAGLLLTACSIARKASDLFGMLAVMGVVGMWTFQILENIGMDIGLMPITGVPLPFFSYGTSFMTVNFIMLGIIGSVWAHNGR